MDFGVLDEGGVRVAEGLVSARRPWRGEEGLGGGVAEGLERRRGRGRGERVFEGLGELEDERVGEGGPEREGR